MLGKWHSQKQPGSHTWVMLNHSLDVIGPLWGSRLQGPLGCGQWELQALGLVCILGGGKKRNKPICPGAANQHGHKLQSLKERVCISGQSETFQGHNICSLFIVLFLFSVFLDRVSLGSPGYPETL